MRLVNPLALKGTYVVSKVEENRHPERKLQQKINNVSQSSATISTHHFPVSKSVISLDKKQVHALCDEMETLLTKYINKDSKHIKVIREINKVEHRIVLSKDERKILWVSLPENLNDMLSFLNKMIEKHSKYGSLVKLMKEFTGDGHAIGTIFKLKESLIGDGCKVKIRNSYLTASQEPEVKKTQSPSAQIHDELLPNVTENMQGCEMAPLHDTAKLSAIFGALKGISIKNTHCAATDKVEAMASSSDAVVSSKFSTVAQLSSAPIGPRLIREKENVRLAYQRLQDQHKIYEISKKLIAMHHAATNSPIFTVQSDVVLPSLKAVMNVDDLETLASYKKTIKQETESCSRLIAGNMKLLEAIGKNTNALNNDPFTIINDAINLSNVTKKSFRIKLAKWLFPASYKKNELKKLEAIRQLVELKLSLRQRDFADMLCPSNSNEKIDDVRWIHEITRTMLIQATPEKYPFDLFNLFSVERRDWLNKLVEWGG